MSEQVTEILTSTLNDYISDVNDPILNFRLALVYDHMGQTAAAISYYTRAAEKTDDDLLAYECLIKIGNCFSAQGKRSYTVKSFYSRAVSLIPTRPEAYFLLARIEEWEKNYFQSYTWCNIALEVCNFECDPLKTDVQYPGKYGILFEQGVSVWWWGNGVDARKIFFDLVDNYWDSMKEEFRKGLEYNISHLGITLYSQSSVIYNKKDKFKLRFNFEACEKIERNFSQVYQDMFVLSMLNGKKNGTYVEIGGGRPYDCNNTWLLENEFGWTGFSLETNEQFVDEYEKCRKNPVYNKDALLVNYKKILSEHFDTKEIDYLQLDIEPAKNTFDALLSIPFDEYKFAVITYEHDDYIDIKKIYKEKSRKYLRSCGYELIVSDISPEGVSSFEDWWVHPDLVDPKIINIMKDVSNNVKKVDDYFLSMKYYGEFWTDKYIRENFFLDQTYKGVFVEVGAGPPEFLSNSKHFRNYGWRTICVEPNPKFVKQHQDVDSEVYQYACSNAEGKSNFTINYNNDDWYTSENDGVSFSSLDIRYKDLPEHNTQEVIEVETIKLDTLLEKIDVEKVDVLSIDTEGWELDVMDGFNVSKYNPKVIVLENFEQNSKYEKYMKKKGYKKEIDLGHNQIYIRKK